MLCRAVLGCAAGLGWTMLDLIMLCCSVLGCAVLAAAEAAQLSVCSTAGLPEGCSSEWAG